VSSFREHDKLPVACAESLVEFGMRKGGPLADRGFPDCSTEEGGDCKRAILVNNGFLPPKDIPGWS
jgi:hypothetical protein